MLETDSGNPSPTGVGRHLLEIPNLEAIHLAVASLDGVESLTKRRLSGGVLAWWEPHGSPVLREIGWPIPEQEVDRPASPAVSHLRRSAAALRSRPPPPWPACPVRALRPQPRYSLARGRGIAGAARATVPAGLPVQSSQALLTLATRSLSPASACPAPRPPPSAPSAGTPRAATSGSRAQRRLQGALDVAVGSWVLPCSKVGGISRFSLFRDR